MGGWEQIVPTKKTANEERELRTKWQFAAALIKSSGKEILWSKD
jgi:hypothetical protein